LAANAGLGFRYLMNSRVFGVNSYYDYRNTRRQHYNQIGAGLESLGRIWDFRINGYLPVGRKQSPFSHPQFAGVEGHSLLIKRKRDFAMKGANAELGLHVDRAKDASLYFAGGPYYLRGMGESTWGGEFRAALDLFHRYFRIEGGVSYDHFFKWIGQAQVSLNIPFGKRWSMTKKPNRSCSQAATLYARAMQRVDRNEIIPIGKQKVVSPATNPATGDPWVFWFVNNTSSSAGTYEDPFPSLLAAQEASFSNQAIYVFPGNGTTQGMDSGIFLKESQLLFGAGVSHTIATKQGKVIIPALASSLPNMTNTMGDVVTLASNNTVSGFNVLVQNGHGLTGTGISNLFTDHNIFIANNPDLDGILLIDPSGQVSVTTSIFSGFSNANGVIGGNGIHVELNPGSLLTSMSITKSQFNNLTNAFTSYSGSGVFFAVHGGTIGSATVSNCSFSNVVNFAEGALIWVSSGNINNLKIFECSFFDINDAWGIYTEVDNGQIDNMAISNCAFANSTGPVSTIETEMFGGFVDNFNISNNIFENIETTSSGVCFTQLWEGTINQMSVAGNAFNTPNSQIFTLFAQPVFTKNISLYVLDNAFVDGGSSPTGYAAKVDMSSGNSGNLCLEFIGNSASPTSNPAPYLFIVSPPATFNRTIGSDNTTNIGQFVIGPGVGEPGTCP